MDFKESWKKFWAFLKGDSWGSLAVSLVLALIFIKFIFFPVLSALTGSPLPLVIVESCSMYHSQTIEQIMQNSIYDAYNVDLEDTKNWTLRNGFNKGDIIFIIGPKDIKKGDVIVFNGGQSNPIIHRVIKVSSDGSYTTKGDNNWQLLYAEKDIPKENVLGKVVFKIPYPGWIKLIFFDWMKPKEQRGLCQ